MAAGPSTIHASAVLVATRAFGAKAVLIRGPSGAGKSRLAWALLNAGACGQLTFARLVADDRAFLEPHNGRLLVRPHDRLAGLLELRALGIRRLPFEPFAVVGLIVDLAADDSSRLPDPPTQQANLEGVSLPRLAIAAGTDPLPVLLAALQGIPNAV